uniref:(northern house mosquito) hypothetical protein n=1 Tax=Culex pipiens TaxID=7175 RepID=A0A8D8GNI4_CULPI
MFYVYPRRNLVTEVALASPSCCCERNIRGTINDLCFLSRVRGRKKTGPDIFARQRATPGHSCVSHQPTSRTINFPPGAQPATTTTTTTGKEQTLPRGVEHGYSIKAELLPCLGSWGEVVGLDRVGPSQTTWRDW